MRNAGWGFKHGGRRGMAAALCLVLLAATLLAGVADLIPGQTVSAAEQRLTLAQARSLALANSKTCKKIRAKIALKKVSYQQAVKSIKLKKKNMTTFRWSPLLSFKFPEKMALADEYEGAYKPVQLQNEITALEHDLADEKFAVYEAVSNLYTEIYGYERTIAFRAEQIGSLGKAVEKNEARLAVGEAEQGAVDALKKSLQTTEKAQAEEMRKSANAKDKLSDLTGLDLSTGYTFVNPYLGSELPRSELEELVQATLAEDHPYYEAKMNTSLALLSMNLNYSLMESQYGKKMSYISTFYQQAKGHEKLDTEAFKREYDKLLAAVDAPWQGSWRILFIRIPKEWLKGKISGVRYVEDEPYALYEAVLGYEDARLEQEALEKELRQQVEDSFETLVSARNSYLTLVQAVEEEAVNLNRLLLLNSLGECTFEEYDEARSQYEERQLEELEALAAYSTLLYSYDRLTCGAVTEYLRGAEIDISSGEGGVSYIADAETVEGAVYYIRSLVEDNMFEFGIYIPEGFEVEITGYELWVNGTQVGERTELKKTIRHLALALDEVDDAFVRLYNGTEFVDDCPIDAESYQGDLVITEGYLIRKSEERRVIGTFGSRVTEETSLAEISLQIEEGEGVTAYAIQNADGKFLFSEDPVAVAEPFRYLSFLSGNLDGLVVKCYGSEEEFLFDAYFDMAGNTLYTETE